MYDSSKQGEMVFRIPSKPKETFVAIDYPDSLVTLNTIDSKLMNVIYSLLLTKHDSIMNLPSFSEETTSLGNDKISTRWNQYNIFTLFEDEVSISELLKLITRYYRQYCFLMKELPEPVMVSAWYNLLSKGDIISEHHHGDGTMSYISANIFVHGVDNSSQTMYYIPNQNSILNVKNNIGDITVFPSWMNHQTSIYQGEEPRMTIGINFIPLRFKEEYWKSRTETGDHDFLENVVVI